MQPTNVLERTTAEGLLFEEARLLDEQDWAGWLSLYEENATFWVPTWLDMETQSSDPQQELSFVYYDSRKGLEERVWRLKSGLSLASAPLSRTLHSINNVQVDPVGCTVRSNFVVHVYNMRQKRAHANFGVYRHELRHTPDGWKIAGKKATLLNDYLPLPLDVNAI
jgi:benzoate/toluate 1,2-dioxygenase beta subunit